MGDQMHLAAWPRNQYWALGAVCVSRATRRPSLHSIHYSSLKTTIPTPLCLSPQADTHLSYYICHGSTPKHTTLKPPLGHHSGCATLCSLATTTLFGKS